MHFQKTYTNDLGYTISEYAPRVEIKGSFQPVPRRVYQVWGLDFQKSYATIYTSAEIQDIQPGIDGDLFEYDGRRWQALSENEWSRPDGWTGVLVVAVGPIPDPIPSFASSDWSLTEQEGDLVLSIQSWPGGAPDYVEMRRDPSDGGQWENIGAIPFVGVLPNDTMEVEIRAVMDGVRSDASVKVSP